LRSTSWSVVYFARNSRERIGVWDLRFTHVSNTGEWSNRVNKRFWFFNPRLGTSGEN
jgi:hypothetical protein